MIIYLYSYYLWHIVPIHGFFEALEHACSDVVILSNKSMMKFCMGVHSLINCWLMTLMNGPLFGSILVKPGMAIVIKFIISGLRIIQDSIRVGSNFVIISDIPI